MIFSPEKSVLLVIDVQGKLALSMSGKDVLMDALGRTIQSARILDIPVLVTEQAPEKIGSTVEPIRQHLDGVAPISKTTFSCWGDKKFRHELAATKRKQVIVTGIETHVCVFQTVADLRLENYQVQVVTDAVSSRSHENKEIGLRRMEACGAALTSTEMLMTELLRSTHHPRFKEILSLIRQS